MRSPSVLRRRPFHAASIKPEPYKVLPAGYPSYCALDGMGTAPLVSGD